MSIGKDSTFTRRSRYGSSQDLHSANTLDVAGFDVDNNNHKKLDFGTGSDDELTIVVVARIQRLHNEGKYSPR